MLKIFQGSQICALRDTTVEICLANGLSKSSLQRTRDSLTYTVVGITFLWYFFSYFIDFIARPQHGKLSDYSTTNDYITYTPNDGNFMCLALNVPLMNFFLKVL